MTERIERPGHVVAVVGGACAGSVVAEILADAGCRVVVFEQNPRPYGKIEDGLPRWHRKQRRLEYERIDARLDRPGVTFVPLTRLGRDLDFADFARDWGWSLVVLCNGAWKDRPLSSPSAEAAVGKGLAYQNPFVYWFNHKEEAGYDGPRYEIHDDAVVVGGGLASIDVVKIIQLELYLAALRERGIEGDLYEMEHLGIPRYLAKQGIDDPESLGVRGCELLYRRRVEDMPLASLPADASEAQRARLPQIRAKILKVAQTKFLFRVTTQRLAGDIHLDEAGERVTGLTIRKTRIEGREAIPIDGSEYFRPARLIVSSIGSIPEPLPGIEMDGSYYAFKDWDVGEYAGLPHVFAAGNVVTGQGNIKASVEHGQRVGGHLVERYVRAAEAAGASPGARIGDAQGAAAAEAALDRLAGRPLLPPDRIEALMARVRERQRAVGYDGDYRAWIDRSMPPDMV